MILRRFSGKSTQKKKQVYENGPEEGGGAFNIVK